MARKLVIVISGMPGCGSTTTGKLLSDRTGIEFFSVGTYYKKLAEKKTHTVDPTTASVKYLSSREGSKKKLHNDIDKMQVELAKKGNIIIESKLGVHMLRNLADFRIWLKADIKTRSKRYAQRERMPLRAAEKLLKEKEKLEKKSFNQIYGFDFFDLEKKADIVIDTSNKTPKEVVAAITTSLRRRKLI